MSASAPYLSVVVTSRNDEHGGNPLGRTQAFINNLIGQCRRHRLQAELIIVEWNPPPDRPRLAEVLDWPDDGGWCEVRMVEVPLEMHQRWRSWQALSLYQMIGKNAGIRRARGEFVLATNIDILFSDELIGFVAEGRLDPDKMYRVDRWDVMPDVPVDGTVDEQLAYCQSHLIRLNAREGTFRVGSDGLRCIEESDVVALGGPIKLGVNWFHREFSGDEPFRWVDNDAQLYVDRPDPAGTTLVLDIEPGPGVNTRQFTIELHDASGRKLAEANLKRRSIVEFTLPPWDGATQKLGLHTRSGGDPIETDLRTLNFRVFRCKLETGARAMGPKSNSAGVRATRSAGSRIGRGLKLAREIWRGNPNVQIRLPLSRRRLANLQLRQDSSGLSFSPNAFRSSGQMDPALPAGMRAIFGTGWYGIEHFKSETFRWMNPKADIVWLPPRDAPRAFLLHVEPGPSIGFKACDVIVRDQGGTVIGTYPVKGRSRIRIPLGQADGPVTTSFEVRGGDPLKTEHGDSRTLALRVFGCAWEGGAADTDLNPSQLFAAGPTVWCANGWNRPDPRGSDVLAAFPGAELIVRPPEPGQHVLTLEVDEIREPNEADHLIIEDGLGRTLFRGPFDRDQPITLSEPFVGGNYYVLRLCRDSHESLDDPWLRLPAIQWSAVGSGDRTRTILRPAPVDRAVPLHTNACGDFTMLALDRWMDLRGYPELDLFSMNIDSMFCWMAHHGGAREEVLEDPMRIYHIEHGGGFTPEGEQKMYERVAAKGLSWLSFDDLLGWARVMNRFGAPMIFNHDDWGLGREVLKETTPRARSRESHESES
jgi:hypothetical protein